MDKAGRILGDVMKGTHATIFKTELVDHRWTTGQTFVLDAGNVTKVTHTRILKMELVDHC